MRRREFITLLGGAAAAWPLAARAQQAEQMRRIGVLMLFAESDPEGQGRAAAFRQAWRSWGGSVGRNLQIDFRWGVRRRRSDTIRRCGIGRTAPDVILVNGAAAIRPRAAGDPHGSRSSSSESPIRWPMASSQSLAHPGGNITGFTVFEPSVGGKWLGLLKEIAPRVTRVAVLVNPDNLSGGRLSDAAAAAAQKFAVEVVAAPVREHARDRSGDDEAGTRAGLRLDRTARPIH